MGFIHSSFLDFFLPILQLQSESSSSGCDCSVISFDLFLKHSAGRYQTRVCALSGLTSSHAQIPGQNRFLDHKVYKIVITFFVRSWQLVFFLELDTFRPLLAGLSALFFIDFITLN